MKFNEPRSILLLGGALLAGAVAGWVSPTPPREPLPSGQNAPAPVNIPGAPSPGAGEGDPGEAFGALPLSNQSVSDDFGMFDSQKQLEVLRRLGEKFGDRFPPSAQLLLARAVGRLSADQASALLEGLPDAKQTAVCVELAKRLAELDPERALELGRKLVPQPRGSALLTQAISAIGEKDVAKALTALSSIPADQRKGVFEGFMDALGSREAGVRGALPDVIAVLKANPSLVPEGQSWRVNRLVGSLLADSAGSDPAAAIAQASAAALEMASLVGNRQRNGETNGPRDEQGRAFVQGILDVLRERDPAAASAFFDAIPENKKTPWMFPFEAIARFRTGGVEAAISLAESQTNEEFTKRAASGTWWGLAQKDRAAALEWIESLPPSSFRQGVLESVRLDAWMQSRSWGSDRAAVEAGAALLSDSTKLDYYTSLMGERRFGSRATSNLELVSTLPISEADKLEILRRVAPIKFD